MSLMQQGSQTERNRNRRIKGSKGIQLALPKAVKLNNDAQVLNSVCPKCGNLVAGFQQAMIIPIAAAEFTTCQLAIPKKGIFSVSTKGKWNSMGTLSRTPPR